MKLVLVTSCLVLLIVLIHTDHVESAPPQRDNQGSDGRNVDQSRGAPSGERDGDNERTGKGKNNGSNNGKGKKLGHFKENKDEIKAAIQKKLNEKKGDSDQPAGTQTESEAKSYDEIVKEFKERFGDKSAAEILRGLLGHKNRKGATDSDTPPESDVETLPAADPAPEDTPTNDEPAPPPPAESDPAAPAQAAPAAEDPLLQYQEPAGF